MVGTHASTYQSEARLSLVMVILYCSFVMWDMWWKEPIKYEMRRDARRMENGKRCLYIVKVSLGICFIINLTNWKAQRECFSLWQPISSDLFSSQWDRPGTIVLGLKAKNHMFRPWLCQAIALNTTHNTSQTQLLQKHTAGLGSLPNEMTK